MMRVLARLCLVVAVVAPLGGCSRGPAAYVPELESSLEHLRSMGAKAVYFNGPAFPHLVRLRPDWLPVADHSISSERVRSMAQSALSPKLFRQLDRQERFDALLLVGDPVQFRPLMEHLNRTRDWALDRVDPWCLVYKRGDQEGFTADSIWKVVRESDAKKASERAGAMAAMAERLVAASRLSAAGELIEAAKQVDSGHPAVSVAEGWYRLARGEWKQAVAAAERALKADKTSQPALSVKAQGLYYTKNYLAAYDLSLRLLEESPDDPVMLFTHAKIAHEVKSYGEEIQILEKLIGIANREKRSPSWYHVYLGQALAVTGKGREAILNFDKALSDPELPPDQKDFATSARAKVALQVLPQEDGGVGKSE